MFLYLFTFCRSFVIYCVKRPERAQIKGVRHQTEKALLFTLYAILANIFCSKKKKTRIKSRDLQLLLTCGYLKTSKFRTGGF